ncbi:MAG: biopolymer transporter ExbD [Chlamydiia bacterium]|nr:biopolymer transporter ExbD [Chlamydiia bacterium]
MRFETNLKTSPSLIDLTPLVDVIFLLLIFFIVTSDILPLKSLHIENPSLDLPAPPLTTHLPLIVDRERVIYIGSKKNISDLDSLQEDLKREIAKHSDPSIVLSIDKDVDYETFMRIFSITQTCCSKIRLSYHADTQT